MSKVYDIAILGCTGFTGRRVAWHLQEQLNSSGSGQYQVALASRNTEKAKKLFEATSHSYFEFVSADCSDPKSLETLARNSRVLINCTGPFSLLGEAVVKACIDFGCHYIDITGETQFIEKTHLDFYELAYKKRVLIIPSCGFDSVPSDLGLEVLRKKTLDRNIQLIEGCLEIDSGGTKLHANATTFTSAILGLSTKKNLKVYRQQLLRRRWKKKVSLGQKLKRLPHFDPIKKQWKLLFPGSDSTLVKISNQIRSQKAVPQECLPDYHVYFYLGKTLNLFKLLIMVPIVGILTKFKWGIQLLINNPEFFTWGLFRKEGPGQKDLETTRFNFYFQALSGGEVVERLVLRGPEPGYIATPLIVVAIAELILGGHHNQNFGVLTPSTAFDSDLLLERLKSKGFDFQYSSD